MKVSHNSEIELHHQTYIDKNLSELYMERITLSVPLLDGAVLINSPTIVEKGQVVLSAEKPGNDFIIQRVREDENKSTLLQVKEGDDMSPTFGDNLFYAPVASLYLSRRERFLWEVDAPPENIKNLSMLRDFIGILSVFALTKQLKMKDR